MTCEEGRDGTTVTYRERLSPPWWVWTLGALFAGGVGVAYGFALGPVAGMAAATALALGTGLLLVASTVTISVDECVLRVGRARLPVRFAGEVTTLDPEAAPGTSILLPSFSYARGRPPAAFGSAWLMRATHTRSGWCRPVIRKLWHRPSAPPGQAR